MKSEIHQAMLDAFCSELGDIKVAVERNGGKFGCDREIDNAKDCVQAIKDLMKIEVMMSGKSIVR